jgi:hypothetical protein
MRKIRRKSESHHPILVYNLHNALSKLLTLLLQGMSLEIAREVVRICSGWNGRQAN